MRGDVQTMKTRITISILCAVCSSILFSGAAYANLGMTHTESITNANSVTVKVTGVPEGVRAIVCIFEDSTCTQRGSTSSQPAGASGEVFVKVEGTGFAVGDKIRVNAQGKTTYCARIARLTGVTASSGGPDPTEDGLCAETCEECDNPIPTVSEWGLVVMTLLGLTVGTIVFARRRMRGTASAG